jgi:hypothetical protein
MSTPNYYLALYTGPGGPISLEFEAENLQQAREIVAEEGSQWFNSGADDLNLDPASPTLDDDIVAALEVGAWTLALHTEHADGNYAIYEEKQAGITRNDIYAGIMALLSALHDKDVQSGAVYQVFQGADPGIWHIGNYKVVLRICTGAGWVTDTNHLLSLTTAGRIKLEAILKVASAHWHHGDEEDK